MFTDVVSRNVLKWRSFIVEIDKGFKLTIGQAVLGLQLICNFLRLFYIIDP